MVHRNNNNVNFKKGFTRKYLLFYADKKNLIKRRQSEISASHH